MIQKATLKPWSLLSLSVLILFITALGAITLVWMRQQTTHSASSCKHLEIELHKLEIKSAFLSSKIAQMHNPQYLLSQVKDGFRRPSNEQVIGEKRVDLVRPTIAPTLALKAQSPHVHTGL